MIFNSLEFLIFLPIVFIIYWSFKKSVKAQNLFICIASYLFYGWWNYKFLFLIICTTFLSFASGLLIKRYREKLLITKTINILSIFFQSAYFMHIQILQLFLTKFGKRPIGFWNIY